MRFVLVCSVLLAIFSATDRPSDKKAPDAKASTAFHPGQVFRDCPDCPEMVVIPAGSFLMGAPTNEPGRDEIEGPQRRVNIAQFAAGKFDITRGQWKAFVADTNRKVVGGCAWAPDDQNLNPNASWEKLGFPQDDNHPVVCVSWQDVQDYIHWLSGKTGKKYRLLSEAEWEYAARAGSADTYPWGDTLTHKQANYGAEKCCSPLAKDEDKWEETSPVGSFPPNKFGLYDMSGNVLQWVQDCFSDSYANGPTDGTAYERSIKLQTSGHLASMSGTDSCSYRIVRGGDWGDPPRMLRSAFRNYAPGPGATLDNYRSGGLGLRVARTLK
jgi:formylglycine-generating enzyme required for sulfatase activity